MFKMKLLTLDEKVMVATNANNMLRWSLGKPAVNIIESLQVFLLETTQVTTVDEDITWRNRQLTMLSVCVCDDTN